MKPLYNRNLKWVHHITRPFSLFGASLWHRWYNSEYIRNVLELDMPDALFVEEHPSVVRQYRRKEQYEAVTNRVKYLLLKKPDYLLKVFRKGIVLNTQAVQRFDDFSSAVDFLTQMAVHCTVLPFWAGNYANELGIRNRNLDLVIKELRAVSSYPGFIKNTLVPLAQKHLSKLGITAAKESINLLTVSEILKGDTKLLEERRRHRKQRFIYQVLNGSEIVNFTSNVAAVVRELEGANAGQSRRQIIGRIACPGKVRGKARIVLTNDPTGIAFSKGDILISTHISPALMPLVHKCSAIVTEEGATAGHAQIIAREMNIPCVIGARMATTLLKDGDLVEVDADKGTVRVLLGNQLKK